MMPNYYILGQYPVK